MIILQDIKDLVMYLTITPVSIQFINFFHLPIVDRFLRALIIYFQYYIEIWEDLTQKRVIMVKKAPNPLAGGTRIRYASEMRTLRCILGREYAELIVGCKDSAPYHHMTTGKKNMSNDVATQSQGEKDLRIFEVLIRIAHRVVWIAMQRKYFNVIGSYQSYMHRTLLCIRDTCNYNHLDKNYVFTQKSKCTDCSEQMCIIQQIEKVAVL